MSDASVPALNAFACLGIPESFDICPKLLEKNYEQSQYRVHPDQWDSLMGKQVAEKLSMQCNQAYDILRHPQKRAQHLLQCSGHWPLPHFPDLLEVVLDWREKGHHPDALTLNQACEIFSKAWNQGDMTAAQRAYWWISVTNQRP